MKLILKQLLKLTLQTSIKWPLIFNTLNPPIPKRLSLSLIIELKDLKEFFLELEFARLKAYTQLTMRSLNLMRNHKFLRMRKLSRLSKLNKRVTKRFQNLMSKHHWLIQNQLWRIKENRRKLFRQNILKTFSHGEHWTFFRIFSRKFAKTKDSFKTKKTYPFLKQKESLLLILYSRRNSRKSGDPDQLVLGDISISTNWKMTTLSWRPMLMN